MNPNFQKGPVATLLNFWDRLRSCSFMSVFAVCRDAHRRTLSLRKRFPRILVRRDHSAQSSAQMASPTPTTSSTSTNASTTPASNAAISISSAAINGGGGGYNGLAAAGTPAVSTGTATAGGLFSRLLSWPEFAFTHSNSE